MAAALLPLAVYLPWLILYDQKPASGWRPALLRAAVLCGIYLVLLTEALSLGGWVTRVGLAAGWGGWCAAWGAAAWRARGRLVFWPAVPRRVSASERILLAGCLAVLAVSAVVAWFAPPHTYDSLNYHMPRVAQWAQNRSIAHFATGIDIQNTQMPGAELIVLHLYVLAGSDRLANFAAWASLAGSLVAVSSITSWLGAARPAQVLAAALTAALPMAITQASSTMTDLVAGFWLVTMAVFLLEADHYPDQPGVLLWCGAAASLAILTKGTVYAFLLPFLVWAAVLIFRQYGWRGWLKHGLAVLLIVLALVGPHIARTLSTYGQIFDPRLVNEQRNELPTPAGLFSNLLRHTGMQLRTPLGPVNFVLHKSIARVHRWIGLDLNDPRTTSQGHFEVSFPSFREDNVTNLIQMGLILAVAGAMVIRRGRFPRRVLIYAAACLATLVVFSAIYKWQTFSSRYVLPYFLLSAPVIGVWLGRWRWGTWVGVIALAYAVPWLVSLGPRPLLPIPGLTHANSILTESRDVLLFVNDQGWLKPAIETRNTLDDAGCSQLRIALGGRAAEYPLWALLKAPRPDLRIQWLVAGTPSARYMDPGFHPCAVLCQSCPEEQLEYNGLPRVFNGYGVQIFLDPGPLN